MTFKSPYTMLMEIGKVWDDLSDVSRANIGELLFGKRQANIGFAILENYEMAEEILKTAENSTGSAMREQEIFLDSIQGRLNQLESTWQVFSSNALDSGAVKAAVSGLELLIKALDVIVNDIGLIPIGLTAATAALIKFGKAGKDCALLPQAA